MSKVINEEVSGRVEEPKTCPLGSVTDKARHLARIWWRVRTPSTDQEYTSTRYWKTPLSTSYTVMKRLAEDGKARRTAANHSLEFNAQKKE